MWGVVPCQQAVPCSSPLLTLGKNKNPRRCMLATPNVQQHVTGLSSPHRIQRLFAVQLIISY
jgi:hypothetical protein